MKFDPDGFIETHLHPAHLRAFRDWRSQRPAIDRREFHEAHVLVMCLGSAAAARVDASTSSTDFDRGLGGPNDMTFRGVPVIIGAGHGYLFAHVPLDLGR